jgi:hypothetical protein
VVARATVKNKKAANLKAASGRVYSPKVLGRSNEYDNGHRTEPEHI